MLHNDEKRLLNLINLGPIFIIFFSLIITFTMIENSNTLIQDEMKEIREESLNQKKIQIKTEVQRVYNLIHNEKIKTINNIHNNLKHRVEEAYIIANSIYKKNPEKNINEIKKLIKDALREIRFDKKRNSYFIYSLRGENILLPTKEDEEGKNSWDVIDANNKYFIQDLAKIAKNKNEGFYTSDYKKENEDSPYEKVSYVKYFKPFNWIIGTSKYTKDYEEELKNMLLTKIQNIKYGKNSYIFVFDHKGLMLSHYRKSYIGTNRINIQDINGFMIIQEGIKIAKKGEGYMTYIGTVQPSTKKPAKKISYVKGFEDWNWVIGTGVYLSDIEEVINAKKMHLEEKNNKQIIKILIISAIAFIMLFLFSLYFTQKVRSRFQNYKQKVEEKTQELNNFNDDLELKVETRTKNLNYINSKLKQTIKNLSQTKKDLIKSEVSEHEMEEKVTKQSKNLSYVNKKLKNTVMSLTKTKKDLIQAEKMSILGELVGSITHEINSPLGVCITSSSHLEEETKRLISLYTEDKMSEDDFKTFMHTTQELSKILSLNLNNAKNLVTSFKNVAVDQATEDLREFDIKKYINEILLALKSKLKKTQIDIEVECEDNIILHSYPGYLSQIFTNLINNSILHGFKENEKGVIKIYIKNFSHNIELKYYDSGKGIPLEIRDKVFDQYFTTKKGSGGTGLGLYIINEIITDKLKGSIKINSKNKIGIEFIIDIPKIAIKSS